MKYTALEVEIKSPDWKIVNAIGVDGVEVKDASINRTSKKGDVFSNFDSIQEGAQFEADVWRNDAGKAYLFAPKPKTTPTGANKGQFGAVKAAQERKGEMIEKSMDRKEEAIALAGAMRDATLISLQSYRDQSFPSDEEYKAEWTKWCKWILGQHDQPFI